MSASSPTLRVGTRGSLLARTQTGHVVDQIQQAHPGLQIVTEIIQTTGDMRRDVPFAAVGTKGMFVKEIEQALLDGVIDVGVHSLKDMPGELPSSLELACIPKREDPFDALISRNGLHFADLPQGAVIGTSSIRRQAQLHLKRPDLQIVELRGNLDTRLRKLDEGQYDAIILACAGLNRLGMADRIVERLSPDICIPAAGQGALALETRVGDSATLALLSAVHDPAAAICITAERAFLAELGGGCSVPAGAYARFASVNSIQMDAILVSPDGSQAHRWTGHQELGTDPLESAAQLGKACAEDMKEASFGENGKG